jgi:hypothetical protein
VSDRESAVECIEENMILRPICPGSFELNDGLFVAVEDEDLEYLEPLTLSLRHSCLHASCGTCGVRVNGREELACVCDSPRTATTSGSSRWPTLPTLSDVVVDMRPFYERLRDGRGLIRALNPIQAPLHRVLPAGGVRDARGCGA